MSVVGSPHGRARFLLVEDDPLVGATYRRILCVHGDVAVVSSVAEARSALAAGLPTGLLTDIALPDGSGLDVAREARAAAPGLPILVVSGLVDPPRLDRVDEIAATFLLKPLTLVQLARFAERAIARERHTSLLLLSWTGRYGLSAAEARALRLAVDGLRRDEIAREGGVSANTVKHQITSLLRKAGAGQLAELVATFYRELSAP